MRDDDPIFTALSLAMLASAAISAVLASEQPQIRVFLPVVPSSEALSDIDKAKKEKP